MVSSVLSALGGVFVMVLFLQEAGSPPSNSLSAPTSGFLLPAAAASFFSSPNLPRLVPHLIMPPTIPKVRVNSVSLILEWHSLSQSGLCRAEGREEEGGRKEVGAFCPAPLYVSVYFVTGYWIDLSLMFNLCKDFCLLLCSIDFLYFSPLTNNFRTYFLQ